MVLTGVFTSALEETDKKPTQIVTSEVLAEASHVAVDISSSVPVASTPRNQTPGLLVSLQVEEPEVVLLADAKQKYTDALILKVNQIFLEC